MASGEDGWDHHAPPGGIGSREAAPPGTALSTTPTLPKWGMWGHDKTRVESGDKFLGFIWEGERQGGC